MVGARSSNLPRTLTMKIATYAGASFTILMAALFCSVTQVKANTITYSLSTTASGSLGGSPFTNAPVTVTLTGDTANVAPGPVPFNNLLVNSGAAKVTSLASGQPHSLTLLRSSPRLPDLPACFYPISLLTPAYWGKLALSSPPTIFEAHLDHSPGPEA